jgi:acyl-CoA hydrolase
MKEKKVCDSALINQVRPIFPSELNSNKSVFGGHVMALLDRAALVVAERHTERTCVTASVDAMHFLAPGREGEFLVIDAACNRTWNSSCEVGLKVRAENPKTGESKHVVSAYYTFVAVDENGKPIPINPIAPDSRDEKRRYEEADLRRKNRVKHANELKKFRDEYEKNV